MKNIDLIELELEVPELIDVIQGLRNLIGRYSIESDIFEYEVSPSITAHIDIPIDSYAAINNVKIVINDCGNIFTIDSISHSDSDALIEAFRINMDEINVLFGAIEDFETIYDVELAIGDIGDVGFYITFELNGHHHRIDVYSDRVICQVEPNEEYEELINERDELIQEREELENQIEHLHGIIDELNEKIKNY